ncbi:caib/baif family protein [Bradymonas sediminis]|uniref:Caib/baif family protein n=1 Tax=Bradymonas sediminis TaxID=1548548 RepID=A0A2Z4FPW0_9DELT|nr:caib/baif family protein [Bradymonas sediminis]AWV91101.1 caib/baif family protein [Bradymonas sediminis]TDP75155.1 replication restart DNA helicase PriA [Bradymonas sediminis]
MAEGIPLDKSGFERALRALSKEVKATRENPDSYKCEGSQRCYGCTFTTDSVDCFSCTYCVECKECSECTHCVRCENLHASSYCVDSRNCSNSSYLVMSEDCSDCVFCFGCVGLVKKEFHILNQKFRRDEYFKKIKELEAEFGLKRGR